MYHQQDVQLEKELKRLEMEYSALKTKLEGDEKVKGELTPKEDKEDSGETMTRLENTIKLTIELLETAKQNKVEVKNDTELLNVYTKQEN